MSYLLDTNILAVYTSKKPERAVLEWLDSVPGHALHLSVLTLGDIRKGAELAPDPRFRERLRQCGGRLEIATGRSQGFRLTMTLPVAPSADPCIPEGVAA